MPILGKNTFAPKCLAPSCAVLGSNLGKVPTWICLNNAKIPITKTIAPDTTAGIQSPKAKIIAKKNQKTAVPILTLFVLSLNVSIPATAIHKPIKA